MTGDTYFLRGEVPWLGVLACLAFAGSLMYASVRIVERREQRALDGRRPCVEVPQAVGRHLALCRVAGPQQPLERIDQDRARTMNINARPDLNTTANTHDNVWNWMVRVDHQINANNTWAVRWLQETSPQTNQLVNTFYTLRRAEEEQDKDWTIVGSLNSVIANTRVNSLKISYTHEDVFFGNPGYFEKGDQTV
jgi:hypothetical protein